MNWGRILSGIASAGITEIPGVRSGFDRLTGQGKYDPVNKAMPYLNQAGEQLQGGYGPYIQQGQEAYGQLNPQYNQMINNPGEYLHNLSQGYEQSPGYNFKRDEMLKAAGNTAAAGGMRGSLGDIQNEAHLSEMLAGEDFQQWLQNIMGINKQGFQGQEGFYNKGFEANNNLTSGLANLSGTKSGLSFQGQSQQNKTIQDLISSLIANAGKIAGTMAGGGAGAMGGGGPGGFM